MPKKCVQNQTFCKKKTSFTCNECLRKKNISKILNNQGQDDFLG